MNESSITIRWEKNPDGSTDISVSGDKDYINSPKIITK